MVKLVEALQAAKEALEKFVAPDAVLENILYGDMDGSEPAFLTMRLEDCRSARKALALVTAALTQEAGEHDQPKGGDANDAAASGGNGSHDTGPGVTAGAVAPEAADVETEELAKRLDAPAYWMSGSSEGHEGDNDALVRTAVDRLRTLSAENARLRAQAAMDVGAEKLLADLAQFAKQFTARSESHTLIDSARVRIRVLYGENLSLRAELDEAWMTADGYDRDCTDMRYQRDAAEARATEATRAAVMAEREACAKVADEIANDGWDGKLRGTHSIAIATSERIATAIRSRT